MSAYTYSIDAVTPFRAVNTARLQHELTALRGPIVQAVSVAGDDVTIVWDRLLRPAEILDMERILLAHTGIPPFEAAQEALDEAISTTQLTTPQTKLGVRLAPLAGGAYTLTAACEIQTASALLTGVVALLTVDGVDVALDDWAGSDQWHAVSMLHRFTAIAGGRPTVALRYLRRGDPANVSIRRASLLVRPLTIK